MRDEDKVLARSSHICRRRRLDSKCSGFSLLEMIVVVVVISILLVIAISRLLALQVDAERVAMQTVIGVIGSALGMKVADGIVRQNVRDLASLEGGNPMDRLAQIPENYLGQLDDPDPRTLEDGNWYFDKRSRTLVYLVRNKGFFQGGLSDPSRARFKILLVYTDHNGNGRYDPGIDVLEGLRLAVMEPYQWIK